jgi:hypothetical protein
MMTAMTTRIAVRAVAAPPPTYRDVKTAEAELGTGRLWPADRRGEQHHTSGNEHRARSEQDASNRASSASDTDHVWPPPYPACETILHKESPFINGIVKTSLVSPTRIRQGLKGINHSTGKLLLWLSLLASATRN